MGRLHSDGFGRQQPRGMECKVSREQDQAANLYIVNGMTLRFVLDLIAVY